MGLQKVGHDWETELNWRPEDNIYIYLAWDRMNMLFPSVRRKYIPFCHPIMNISSQQMRKFLTKDTQSTFPSTSCHLGSGYTALQVVEMNTGDVGYSKHRRKSSSGQAWNVNCKHPVRVTSGALWWVYSKLSAVKVRL